MDKDKLASTGAFPPLDGTLFQLVESPGVVEEWVDGKASVCFLSLSGQTAALAYLTPEVVD